MTFVMPSTPFRQTKSERCSPSRGWKSGTTGASKQVEKYVPVRDPLTLIGGSLSVSGVDLASVTEGGRGGMDGERDRDILGVTALTAYQKVEEWTEIPQWRHLG